ncbi:MAG: hypothetical protein ACT4OM_01475 [Actinomycetota bacterium]
MNTSLPSTLTIVAWHDSVIDALGVEPDSPYLEHLWLPVIGPSAAWTYRRLAIRLRAQDPHTVEVESLAQAMGLGTGTGVHSPMVRTLGRLVRFGLASHESEDTLGVRLRAPWLNERAVRRLSPQLQRAHVILLAKHQEDRPRKAG